MGSSPDAQCGLDEGGDAHTGEDGANELADHVLVTAHTQRLSQQEGHGDGAAEAGQVVLGAGESGGQHVRQGPGSPPGSRGASEPSPCLSGPEPRPAPPGSPPGTDTPIRDSHRATAHLSGSRHLPQVTPAAPVGWASSLSLVLPLAGDAPSLSGPIKPLPHRLGDSHCC